MTESERRYINATAKIDRLEKGIAVLENKVKQVTYEKALALSEIVRLRRMIEAQDDEKHKLLTEMAELSIKLRRAERWNELYKRTRRDVWTLEDNERERLKNESNNN